MLNRYRKKNWLFIIVLCIFCVLYFPDLVLAKEFPNSITNIYELRDASSLLGYTGTKRVVGSDASQYGYYLGSQTQFLPYKVGASSVDATGAVTDYEYAVYCTMFGSASPAKNSYLVQTGIKESATRCIVDNSWDIGIQAGVAAIINKANTTKFSGNGLQTYYDTEVAINQFLYEKLGNKCNIDSSQCGDSNAGTSINKIENYNETLVNLAQDAYALAKSRADNELMVTFPNTKQLVYNEVEEIWKNPNQERIRIQNLKYLDNYNSGDITNLVKISMKDSKNKNYDDYVYITYVETVDSDKDIIDYQIGVCNNDNSEHYYCSKISNFEPLAPGTYTVTLTIGGTKTYQVSQNYSCGTNYQGITPAFTNKKTDTIASKIATFTFTVEEPEEVTGRIKVSKLDSKTEEGIVGAKFKIENADGSYSDTFTMSKSYYTINNLPLGTYIITEITAPSGYQLTKKAKEVSLTESDTYESVEFYNEPFESKVSVIKVDATDDDKILKGATLHIVDKDGKEVVKPWVTTEKAYVITGLSVGKYYIEELEAPTGYSLNDNKQAFEIKSNSDEINVEFANNKIVNVPDTLSNTSKIIVMLAVIGILTGGILIYKNKFSEDGRKI